MTDKIILHLRRPVLKSLFSHIHRCRQHSTLCPNGYCRNAIPLTGSACVHVQKRFLYSKHFTSEDQKRGLQGMFLCSTKKGGCNSPWLLKINKNNFIRMTRRNSTCDSLSKACVKPSRFRNFLLDSWFVEVSPFGKLNLNCHFPSRIEILDPQDFQNQNKACVYILHEDILENDDADEITDAPPVQRLRDVYRLNMKVNEETSEIDVHTDIPSGVHLPLMCLIQIPVKFNLDVNNESDVVIKEFESQRIKIGSINGNCHLRNIKAQDIQVLCKNGDIVSEIVMHGNIHLASDTGDITADRLQGTTIDCRATTGNINIKANYSESANFDIGSGDLRLQNCHGNSDITIKEGSLVVDTLDGNLTAVLQKGNARLFTARHQNISLSVSKGDVILKVPEEFNSSLDLKASKIDLGSLSPSLVTEVNTRTENGETYKGLCGDGSGSVALESQMGNVKLETQDWCSSLGLKFTDSE